MSEINRNESNYPPPPFNGRGQGGWVGFFHSPFTSKFGIPRQSGIISDVEGEVVFDKPYDNPDAIRGIEGFDYLWLLWQSLSPQPSPPQGKGGMMVRPPRLGGNEKVGVFASRSPIRPNGICLSCVKLKEVRDGKLIVLGADLMDGTPILDVKPYVAFSDAHPDARSGFVDTNEWKPLEVDFPEELQLAFSPNDVKTIVAALEQDPRPHYHNDPDRIYGMPFAGKDVRFRVADGKAIVVSIETN